MGVECDRPIAIGPRNPSDDIGHFASENIFCAFESEDGSGGLKLWLQPHAGQLRDQVVTSRIMAGHPDRAA